MSVFSEVTAYLKQAKGRCWDGYEPVPGKEPYSDDSCRPASKKKKEKKSMGNTEKVAAARLLMNAAEKGSLAGTKTPVSQLGKLSKPQTQINQTPINPEFSTPELARLLPLIQRLQAGGQKAIA